MIGHMTGAALCYSIWLGDELGLYRELAGSGPRTADSLAEKTGCHPRLVREWLDGQAAGGLVAYDADSDTYELGPEAAMALADDTSPVFVARAMNAFGSMFMDMQKTATAFRGDGALSWGDHHPCLFSRDGVVLPDRIPGAPHDLMDPRARWCRSRSSRRARTSPTSDAVTGHRVVAMATAYPQLDLHRIRLPRRLRSRPAASGRARPG